MYDILELSKKLLPELREIGKELNIRRVESFKKQDLVYKILDKQAVMVSEPKKSDKKIFPKTTLQEQPEILFKEELLPQDNVVEKIADNEKVDITSPEIIVERQPLIKPFPKRVEKIKIENVDSRERRPRVLRTESALISSTSRSISDNEEVTRIKEVDPEELPVQEARKRKILKKNHNRNFARIFPKGTIIYRLFNLRKNRCHSSKKAGNRRKHMTLMESLALQEFLKSCRRDMAFYVLPIIIT